MLKQCFGEFLFLFRTCDAVQEKWFNGFSCQRKVIAKSFNTLGNISSSRVTKIDVCSKNVGKKVFRKKPTRCKQKFQKFCNEVLQFPMSSEPNWKKSLDSVQLNLRTVSNKVSYVGFTLKNQTHCFPFIKSHGKINVLNDIIYKTESNGINFNMEFHRIVLSSSTSLYFNEKSTRLDNKSADSLFISNENNTTKKNGNAKNVKRNQKADFNIQKSMCRLCVCVSIKFIILITKHVACTKSFVLTNQTNRNWSNKKSGFSACKNYRTTIQTKQNKWIENCEIYFSQ